MTSNISIIQCESVYQVHICRNVGAFIWVAKYNPYYMYIKQYMNFLSITLNVALSPPPLQKGAGGDDFSNFLDYGGYKIFGIKGGGNVRTPKILGVGRCFSSNIDKK